MPLEAAAPHYRKTLGVFDLTLFTVSAIVLLDTLSATASIGASSVTWWVLLAVLFALPIGLITAEIGTTYPEQGGIYAWVRRAFGARWAARAVWCYWINTALWLPSIFVLFAGFVARLFGVDLPLSAQLAISITLVWIAVVVNCVALEVGKWAPNIGAIFKIVIFLTIIVGGIALGLSNGFANTFDKAALTPTWSEALRYLPAIIYGMLGFELASAGGEEIENAPRDLPRAILLSGVIIIALYTLSTVAILAVVPASDINIVEGLIDVLRLLFGEGPFADALVILFGAATLYTFFSNGVTWALGCNRASAAAADEGRLPRLFGLKNPRHGAPVGSAVLMGIVCTAVLLVYGGAAQSNEDLFWALFSFSAVLFLAPYIGLALAFLRMRRLDPGRPRPFRVPFGAVGALSAAILCVGALGGAILLFLYVPGEGVQWLTLGGVVIALIIGEALIAVAGRRPLKTQFPSPG